MLQKVYDSDTNMSWMIFIYPLLCSSWNEISRRAEWQ